MTIPNQDPIFTLTPNNGGGSVNNASAETSYSAPTHGATVFTAGGSGSRVEEIGFFAIGTTVAGFIQLYLYDGTTYRPIDSVLVPGSVAPGATVQPWSFKLPFANLELKTGWTIYAASFTANQPVYVVPLGGDF